MQSILLGKVKDVDDPKKLGRIRCEIWGRTNGIPKEALPWYIPRRSKDCHDLPKIDETVEIFLINDDILLGYWNMMPQSNTLELSDDDYKSAKVLLYRNLADNGDDGMIEISYRKSIGLTLHLRDAEITERADGSILLKTKFDNRTIDICEKSISLGSESKSAEPGLLGDQTETAFNNIVSVFNAIDKAASGNPYTVPISSAIKATIEQLKQQIKKIKSEHVTLD